MSLNDCEQCLFAKNDEVSRPEGYFCYYKLDWSKKRCSKFKGFIGLPDKDQEMKREIAFQCLTDERWEKTLNQNKILAITGFIVAFLAGALSSPVMTRILQKLGLR